MSDTIVAIATPPGHGGIGVVRISGPEALAVASALVEGPNLLPRHATFVRVREPGGPALDHALATFFPAPHSYSGDDIVEISAHGSPALLTAIVRAAIGRGARMAGPGEFTLRAFLNGRLDLVQAEAVGDLVAAVTPLQARVAFDQLEGTLTREIGEIDRDLFDVCARLEAGLDFPEEGYHFVEPGEVEATLEGVRVRIAGLLESADSGRVIRTGAQVAVVGRPNVGKSTLFNALVGADRAIVTAHPGTTRDLVSETCALDGVPLVLVDTAGVREASDEVEREGVARSRRAAGVADVVLVVCDASTPPGDEDRRVWALAPEGARVLVLNKADLGVDGSWHGADASWGGGRDDRCEVSARERSGLGGVRDAILARLGGVRGLVREGPLVTNVRHETLLREAEGGLRQAVRNLSEAGGSRFEELVLADVGAARAALESIVGRRTPEDVLRRIFERFCIGK